MSRFIACLASALLLLAAALFARPYYNWDMLMYVGIAQMQEKTLEDAHRDTYADAARTIQKADYQDLIRPDGYRDTIANDPKAFSEQLPFYTVKPLYPLFIAALQKTGMSGMAASILIPQICLALLAALCCYLLSGYFKPIAAFAISSALVATPYIFVLARYASPDALSVLILAGLTILFLQPRSVIVRAITIVLAILCRPDTVVYIVFLLLAWSVFFRSEWKTTAALGIVCLGTYLTLTSMAESYSWFVLFKQSFLGPNPYPASNQITPNLRELFEVYSAQINPEYSSIIILMCMLSVLSIVCVAAVFGVKHPMFAVSLVCLLTLMAHWLIAPNSSNRFRSGYHLISLLFLVIAIGQLVAPKLPAPFRRWVLAT